MTTTKMKRVRRPKVPNSGEIAGWYLGSERRDDGKLEEEAIREGTLTAADAKKLVVWVTEWAKWVEWVEKDEERQQRADKQKRQRGGD